MRWYCSSDPSASFAPPPDSAIISMTGSPGRKYSIENTTSDTANRSGMVRSARRRIKTNTVASSDGPALRAQLGRVQVGGTQHVVRQIGDLRGYGIDQHLFEAANDDRVVAHNFLNLLVHRQPLGPVHLDLRIVEQLVYLRVRILRAVA